MPYLGIKAEIPLGPDGLTGTNSLTQAKPTQFIVARNITYENGTIQKEGGAAKYNATAITGTPSILGGWDWWPNPTTQRMVVVTSAGAILKDDGGLDFDVTLKSSLTVTGVVPVFVEGGAETAAANRKLFIFTAKNAVQVLSADGATTTDLSSPPTDWTGSTQPLTGVIHEGRLWGFMGHRAYYSTPDDHEDFVGTYAGTMTVFPGEGEGISGAVSYKGLLIIWKYPFGVYAIDTSDITAGNWRVFRLTRAAGMYSPLGYCLTDDDIVFIDQSGNVQAMSGITEFGDIGSRNISQIALLGNWTRENIELSYLKYAQAIYYGTKREIHFALTGTGYTVNNRRLVIDLNRLDLPRFRWSDRDTPVSLWLRKNTDNLPSLTCGDNAGFVWLLDQEARSKDGLGYVAEFQTPYLDLSHIDPSLAAQRKNGDFLELVIEPKGDWDLSVDIIWDGTITETVSLNMGDPGTALGDFTLGSDVLCGGLVASRRVRITGSGHRLSIAGRNNGAGQDFSVAKMYLYFRPSDERL